jgi:hypothetical protein
MQRVTTAPSGRKPPHYSQPGPAGADPHRAAPKLEPERTPRPRAFEAERVRERRQAKGVYASSAVYGHLRSVDFPRGTRACPVRGCDVADAALAALERAVAGRWGTHEGTALALLEALQRAGYLRWPGLPSKLSAGAAMAMLARSCRLVERTGHGRYRIHACKPSDLPAWILNSLLQPRWRDASAPADSGDSPADASRFDASDSPSKLSAPISGNRERACGNFSSGPSSASVGEAQGLAPGCPGAVAGSSSAPAERARTRPATSPARAPLEPLGAWHGSIPNRPQLRRAADLAAEFLTGQGVLGSPAIVAGWLAQREDRASARSRAALARALQSLIRRGVLADDGDRIRLQTRRRAAPGWRCADPRIGRSPPPIWGPEDHTWGNYA